MAWGSDSAVALRLEAHFGDRVVRCFADRSPDTFSLFEASVKRVPDAEARRAAAAERASEAAWRCSFGPRG